MTRVSHFVALGDSITAGLGDGVSMGRDRGRNNGPALHGRGWAAVLANCFDPAAGVAFTNLATTGATATDVRRRQLPVALCLEPDLVSVIAGMNDLLKPSFDPLLLRQDLVWTVGRLRAAGVTVLTAKLHDPTRLLRLPGPLRRRLAARVLELNAAVDAAAGTDPGVLVVDLSAHDEVYRPTTFDVDRVHPGPYGHRLLAQVFAERLAAAGAPIVRMPAATYPTPPRPSRLDHAVWLACVGVPWLVGRCLLRLDGGARRLPAAGTGRIGQVQVPAPGERGLTFASRLPPGPLLPTVGECNPAPIPFPGPPSSPVGATPGSPASSAWTT
jgi:lysophospholipase L1-like esterase